jgi:hypothetical protein
MNEYISKPIREKELFSIIEDLLKTNHGGAELNNESSYVS